MSNIVYAKNMVEQSMALHCMESVRIQSFSGPYFPVLGLNTEIYPEIYLEIYSVFTSNAGK